MMDFDFFNLSLLSEFFPVFTFIVLNRAINTRRKQIDSTNEMHQREIDLKDRALRMNYDLELNKILLEKSHSNNSNNDDSISIST